MERDYRLDIIRSCAIILVVLNHTVELIYPIHEWTADGIPVLVQDFSFKSQLFALTVFSVGRVGVPLFLMLTGYLLLTRDYSDDADVIKFYRTHLVPLLITWEIWILIYQIFIAIYNQVPFDLLLYVERASFLSHAGLMHTWYIPVLLGLYVFLPYISRLLHSMNGRTVVFWICLVYFAYFLIPSVNLVQQWISVDQKYLVTSQLGFAFSGGEYGFYLICGYLIHRYQRLLSQKTSKKAEWNLILVFFIALFITSLCSIWSFEVGEPYRVWYSFLTLPILAVTLFLILDRWRVSMNIKWIVYRVSKYSFGIYLVHVLILLMYRDWWQEMAIRFSYPLITVATAIITMLASIGVVFLLSKIKTVNKWLFLNK
ncbi:acyltransferase [Faecalibaculum rodentium]|uniref:Acyltransferase 3 domain-containing protein n=1 Tax=Faecalibaculum rodentium TaxID=1702221 RepID=A0A1Q9YJG7_9FIRM|nr:acyltransferase [Faecalibaculum rodentium]OLU44584.1 hypothetical protein BO223_07845 [Faecalibaculum rodentium]